MALAGVGAVAARQIRSPAQIAADTAAPAASIISVPVERRALATEVIVRGTVRYGAPQEVTLPVSTLKTSTSVVSSVPKPGARLDEGQEALVVSGRPVFVFRGATPMHRDLGPGSEGRDVRQLEQALARAGFSPGSVDGRYDGATATAVAAMYSRRNEAPFGPTDLQVDQLRTAAATAAAARDGLLQMRLALRTAEQGATPADVNQAQVDASAAAELIPPARTAITTAQDKAATARAAIRAAQLQEAETASTASRD
ncbi:MAG: peptidoglycan-binding protein, partial [Thermoleophilaceae bacterium]|nr:peptidoglycan-binding protein [Thermoleophilaceae bacterium]